MKGATIVDLSQPIYQGMPVYPGHVKTVIFTNPTHDETRRMKKDFSYECRGLLMSDHGPTHLDAINHLTPDPNADSIDKISLETFFTPAICLDVSHVGSQAAISKSQLEAAPAPKGGHTLAVPRPRALQESRCAKQVNG